MCFTNFNPFHLFYYLAAKTKPNCMNFSKLSFLTLLFAGTILMNACSDKTDVNVIRKTGVPLSGLQEVPQKPGSGNGTMDLEYNKSTRTLFYKVTWNSLTGNVVGFHIHGVAKAGFNAGVIQSFSGFPAASAGTYSGNVFIDGVLFKETELLNGEYYINIHTPTNPGGEIRGQIEF
jgi:CHRD domain